MSYLSLVVSFTAFNAAKVSKINHIVVGISLFMNREIRILTLTAVLHLLTEVLLQYSGQWIKVRGNVQCTPPCGRYPQ